MLTLHRISVSVGFHGTLEAGASITALADPARVAGTPISSVLHVHRCAGSMRQRGGGRRLSPNWAEGGTLQELRRLHR
jgi:hypothetical protein